MFHISIDWYKKLILIKTFNTYINQNVKYLQIFST